MEWPKRPARPEEFEGRRSTKSRGGRPLSLPGLWSGVGRPAGRSCNSFCEGDGARGCLGHGARPKPGPKGWVLGVMQPQKALCRGSTPKTNCTRGRDEPAAWLPAGLKPTIQSAFPPSLLPSFPPSLLFPVNLMQFAQRHRKKRKTALTNRKKRRKCWDVRTFFSNLQRNCN
jgi:hypothetical protein